MLLLIILLSAHNTRIMIDLDIDYYVRFDTYTFIVMTYQENKHYVIGTRNT